MRLSVCFIIFQPYFMLLRDIKSLPLQIVLHIIVQHSAHRVPRHAAHQRLLALGEGHEVEVGEDA